MSLTDLQGTVDFLPKYEVPSPEKKRSVSLLESSLLFLENKWKLQFCRGWEAVVAKWIGAKDNHLLLGCRTPWPVGIPPTANWTWWIAVISELCIFSGFTVFHIYCMMERGEKYKVSNQLQVSSLDLVLQLPAGEVFAKEQLVSTANISHCPVFKMLIYIFFAREVGKHLFHLNWKILQFYIIFPTKLLPLRKFSFHVWYFAMRVFFGVIFLLIQLTHQDPQLRRIPYYSLPCNLMGNNQYTALSLQNKFPQWTGHWIPPWPNHIRADSMLEPGIWELM